MNGQAPPVEVIRCPLHGIPDCSALLNGCSIPNRLAAAYQLGARRADVEVAHLRQVADQREETRAEAAAACLRITEVAMRRDRAVRALVDRWGGLADGCDEDDETYRQCATELAEVLGGLDERPSIADLIDASSFGTPAAKAARASVSDEDAARVVARAEQLRADGAV